MDIGMKIKSVRNDRGMTLKELSEKSELSIGFLSQLERGLTSIAVDSLQKIADIFKVPITYFFDTPKKKSEQVLRSYELNISNMEKGGFINYSLSANNRDKTLNPELIELLPGNFNENTVYKRGNREEFIYILEGILTVFIDNERHELYPGDSIHLASEVEHNLANCTNKNVKVLVVNLLARAFNKSKEQEI